MAEGDGLSPWVFIFKRGDWRAKKIWVGREHTSEPTRPGKKPKWTGRGGDDKREERRIARKGGFR